MAVAFSDVVRMLVNEQKKCDDRLVIGGLETFVQNWIARINQDGETEKLGRAQAVALVLRGYKSADLASRQDMLTRALEILNQETQETPAESSPEIENNFDDDEEEDFTPTRRAEAKPKTDASRAIPVSNYGLDASVTRLQSVGPAYAKKLHKLGIYTVNDLLYAFPRRYDDFSKLKTISELVYGEEVTVLLTACEAFTRDTRRGLKVTTVTFADTTGTIIATFFNQAYLQQQFKAGRRVVVSGKVEQNLGRMSFTSPQWEPVSKSLLHTGRIVPIYPLTEGVTNRWMRRLVHSVVEYWADKVADPMPEPIRERAKLLDLPAALKEIHFPTTQENMEHARRRLILDEFITIQIGVLRQRRRWREQPGRALPVHRQRTNEFVARLPFKLTNAQNRVIQEILGDVEQARPMSRLLQGDVGSGKTVVAAIAMLTAVSNGLQATLLAPTEILAEQHYKTLTKVFADFPNAPRIERLTGSMKDRDKEAVRAKIKSGEIDIAVGTHALLQESVEFHDLALAVIDEQHRFGVEQRALLRAKGFAPHMLVMSATPIPRTLALTLYGDLDLSVINEMPPGRQTIQTKWLEPGRRERAYAIIRKHVLQGEQAYVICPLIEESEAIDTQAAISEYELLRTQVFPDLRVGLIHGKLRPSEKDQAMADFRDHKTDVLVATSVIEVGIDVPNATVMVIQGADRFGLAQLHQFRGRIGRGDKQSFCILVAEKKENATDDRLKVIETTQDGFRLAEEDLKLRGPGEFFGLRQSGLPDLKIAKLSDTRLLEEARGIAQEIFDHDPDLALPEHAVLGQRVNEYWKGKGDLS